MIMPNVVFDIRTSENAQQTLTSLTGVPIPVWEQYLGHESEYEYTDDLVAKVISSHGHLPRCYEDFVFIFFHVTTSANECASFRKYGILDLQQSYSYHDSELREFFEKHDIHIDLDEQILKYRGQRFDISYGACPRQDTEAYKCWAIGSKFYYDYTACGFLSVWERSPYGGQVHRRPEILVEIDNLLKLNLSQEWTSTHDSYEIVAKVSGEKIVYNGDDNQSDKDIVLSYLTKAYFNAFGEPDEEVLLLKNHVQIPPVDILEIKPMRHWKDY